MSILQATNVKKQYQQAEVVVEVLKGITVEFEQNKTYAITGPSGSGKSTLIHVLAGLDDPSQGAIFFDGVDIALFEDYQRRAFLNNSIGLVFQLPYLIAELTVLENIMIKGLIEGCSTEHCKVEAQSILEKVGLGGKQDYNPFSLSGGEQQRVAIARALFNKPAFLLADEPTGNLDVETGRTIVDLLLACQKEWGMGIIVSSHDLYVAQSMQHVFRLEDGLLK